MIIMAKSVTVTELLRNFSEYINRVTYRGESFVLVRGKLKVAELKPSPLGCKVSDLLASLASMPLLSSKEGAAFASDIAKAKKKGSKEVLQDPWA